MSMKRLGDVVEQMEAEERLPKRGALSSNDAHIERPDYWQDLQPTAEADQQGGAEVCPVCGGLGVIKYAVGPGHPRFGRLYPCPRDCEAVQRNRRQSAEKRIERMRYIAGTQMRGLYRHHPDDLHRPLAGRKPLTLSSIEPLRTLSDSQARAWELAKEFASSAPDVVISHNGRAKNSIVLFGDKGYGKTLIASALVNTLEQRGISVFGARLYDIVHRINDVYLKTRSADSSYDDRPEFTANEILQAFVDFPILIIDEFELNNVTASRMDVVESLVNGRYIAGLPTVLTTNLNSNGLTEMWNERVSDRIQDGYWFVRVAGVRLRDQSSEIIS